MRLALVAVGATAAGFTAGALLAAGGGALRAAALLGLIRRLRALLGRGVRIALLLRGCGRGEHAALLLRGLLARILLRGTRIGALLRCARLLLLSLPALSGALSGAALIGAVDGVAVCAAAGKHGYSQPLPEDLVEGAGVVNSVKLVVGRGAAVGDTVEVGEVVGVVSCSTSMVGVGMGWKGT